jgi:hypothetical protein
MRISNLIMAALPVAVFAQGERPLPGAIAQAEIPQPTFNPAVLFEKSLNLPKPSQAFSVAQPDPAPAPKSTTPDEESRFFKYFQSLSPKEQIETLYPLYVEAGGDPDNSKVFVQFYDAIAFETKAYSMREENPVALRSIDGSEVLQHHDVENIRYDVDAISTQLAERPEQVTLFGEYHTNSPRQVMLETIRKRVQKGEKVIYTIEQPIRKMNVYNKELINKLNGNTISAEEFIQSFTAWMPTNRKEAEYFVEVHKAGAYIIPIDEGTENIMTITASGTDAPSYIKRENRDETMAKLVDKLARNNPDAKILFFGGGGHTMKNGEFIRWKNSDPQMIMEQFGADTQQPLGKRLIDLLGEENVYSTFYLGGEHISADFGKLPMDSWDALYLAS